jgi:phage shock protein A
MMRRFHFPVIAVTFFLALAACQPQAPDPQVDMAKLRQAVQKKTEQLYLIHLKLDSAASEITSAELKARNADCSDAEYFAAEAYRNLERADQDLLQIGKELQELFNLDIKNGNSR